MICNSILYKSGEIPATSGKIPASAINSIGSFFRPIIFLFFILCAGSVHAQVTASFTVDDTAGCAPLNVHFTNTSTGATSYSWDIGTGATFTLTDVSTTYGTAGTYTVTLTAYNGTASSTSSVVIRAYAPPTVNFTASDTAMCPGAATTFANTTIAGAWGGVSYNWSFGDFLSDVTATPTHTYSFPGFYNVTLFATNSKGCSNSLTRSSYIHVFTPAAIGFTATRTSFCKAPAADLFTNTTTGRAPLSYAWSFGDGAGSAVISPAHTYSLAGSYDVKLRVSDGKGCIDSLVSPAYINVGSIHAAFIPVSSTCPGTVVTFTNTSTAYTTATWSFGDGGTSTSLGDGVHTYTAGGTYNVRLIVFDGSCYDTVTHPITVNPLPATTFTITPVHPCPPPVTLTFGTTVAVGSTVFWDFGDGATGTGASTTHNFTDPGFDSIKMVVTSVNGCIDTIVKVDTLYNLFVSPTASAFNGCAPLTTSFTTFNYAVVGGIFFSYPYATSSVSWNFADGSALSSSLTPTHVYTAAGVYDPICTVHTVNGCVASSFAGSPEISVGSRQHPSFIDSPRHICADRSIYFRNTSTDTSLIDNYSWDFGDGGIAEIPNPVHLYTLPGVHTVALTVGYNGCNSLPYTITDSVDSPLSVMNYIYSCTAPRTTVSFFDHSLGDESGHLWSFGDGTTSTANNPVHTYPSSSTYPIILSTYNSRSGCRDTAYSHVYLANPTMLFNAYDTTLCRDQVDTIISTVVRADTAAGFDVYGDLIGARRYRWYIDRVADSATPQFVKSFHIKGLHSLSLVITDNHGCQDTLTKNNYLLVAKPVDSFSYAPASGCGPLSVHFLDRSTDLSGVSVTSYAWTFGDGSAGVTGTTFPVWLYTAQGTYTAREIVTDNLGCMDTFQTPTPIAVYKPSAFFNTSSMVVCGGTSIHFANASTGVATSLWIFGDGSTSTVYSPDHVFSVVGSYTVKLVVHDSHSCASDTFAVGPITVNPYPTAAFYMTDSFAVCAPLNVHFVNTSTGSSSYTWTLGDGTSSSLTTPTDVYLTPGYYTVKLVSTNSFGCTDTATGHVNLFGYTGAFSYTPTSGCSPLSVHFTASISSITSLVWDYSDGVTSGLSTSTTSSHLYVAPGKYVPKLTLTDSLGCRNFSLGADTIYVDTVVPGFTINPNPVCINNPVSFHDTSASLLSTATSWTWSVAPGVTSTSSAPVYTYTASGTYPVTLTVTDGIGCSKSVIENVHVNPLPGPINGTFLICNRLTTTFTDTATGGTWTSSNLSVATIGSATGVLTATGTGVTTVSYTMSSGCYVVHTVTVNTSALPISGVAGMCRGATTTLADATVGGTWSSFSTSVATISGTGPVTVTGVTAGTSAISYTVGGCPAILVVTVSPVPGAIGGPSSVCALTTIPLTDTLLTGTWSTTATTASVGSASGIVTGISGGTAIITYTSGLGCFITKTVTVNPISPIAGVSGLCIGGTSTFTDGGGGRWVSSTPAVATIGSISGLVTGVATGTTTITYTLSTGCAVTSTLTVNAGPSNIAGPDQVCAGAGIALNDTAGGGFWSVAPLATATIGSTSGLVTAGSAGVAIVTYSLGAGCTKYLAITVNPNPVAIGGVTHVCLGSTTLLSDATSGGVWSSVPTAIASIGSSGTVNGAAVGAAVVSYTLPTGCFTSIPVTVNSLPSTISGPVRVCVGLTALYTDPSAGGTWSCSPGTVATVVPATGIVTGAGIGIATIDYTISATGCSATTTVTVNNSADPIAGTARVCIANTTTLSNPTSGGVWTSNDVSIATAGSTSGVITGVAAGVTTVTYSLGGSCTATIPVTVNSHPVAITGNTHVCPGANDTLSDTPLGGEWTTANSYIAVVGSSSGIVTGVATGSVTIFYSLGIGCTAYEVITVNPAPAGIIAPSAMCLGATAVVYETTTGGTWSSGATTIATVTTGGGVTAVAGGTAAISYTISDGCSAIAHFPVISVPAITGVHNICAWGDTMTVYDSLPGGSFTSTLVTVSLAGGVISYAPGRATITYTVPAGCFATTALTVNPLPGFITGNRNLCVGLTSTLADSTLIGSWSSGSTGIATVGLSTGVVSGIATGQSGITFTIPSTGCYEAVIVTVNPMPSPLAGVAGICVGATTTLTDTTSGGTWASSSSAVATVSSGGLVDGILAGITTITYTMGAGCYVTDIVTVNAIPAVYTVTGGGNYCASGTGVHVGLLDSHTGVSYQLYNGTTAIGSPLPGTGSSIDFGLETAVGSYKVVATTAAGCTSNMYDSAIVTITPSVTPTVNITVAPSGVICAGTTVTFSSSITNGGSSPIYDWFINGVNTDSSRSSYIYMPSNGDVVFVTLTSNATCVSPATAASNSIAITVDPELIPVVTIVAHPGTVIFPGASDTLVANVVGGGASPKYQWESNGVDIPGATNATYVANNFTNPDSVVCIVTSTGPCGGHAATGGVKITWYNNVGVLSSCNSADGITVIPNPNKGEFVIKGSLANTMDAEVAIEITDMLGQSVYKATIMAYSGKVNEKIIMANTVANGIYLLNIRSGEETHIIHMVIEQ